MPANGVGPGTTGAHVSIGPITVTAARAHHVGAYVSG